VKFYWYREAFQLEHKFGKQVRGMTYHNVRPDSCSLSPAEVRQYLQDCGPDKLHNYLRMLEMALA